MTRTLVNKNNHLLMLDQLASKFNTGNVLTLRWLKENNISAKLAWWYVHSGWLVRLGHQVYKKANTEVDWSGALLAIQNQLKLPIHIGGKSALTLLGRAHFISMQGTRQIILFAKPNTNIPQWFFDESVWGVKFLVYQPLLFKYESTSITEIWVNNSKVLVSSPELAILEMLYLLPHHESFEEVTLIMKGLTQLRPIVIQTLLENCCSVKVKRLFLSLANKYKLPWLDDINLDNVNLGKGKYVVGDGGSYDSKYQISLPVIQEE